MKVAIVCDWLLGTGGAERVVLELHRMYPEAPIYTSQYNPNPKIWHDSEWFRNADIRTTWLQKLPKSLKKFMPILRAWTFSHLDLSDYDLVISSSGAEAKAVKTGSNTVHINYCHSPTHYYWMRYEDYLENPGFGRLDPLARIGLKLLVTPLRKWDYRAAQKPDFMIANSSHIKAMIKKYYDRDSVVVHPPVETDRFRHAADEPRRGFVVAGRQTPYKKFDIVVQAFNQLRLPLLVLGNGPSHSKLEKMADRNVTFIKHPTDEQVAHYFRTSLAFIFPSLDDFGIVAVEALAAGTPVIAYKAGGALDYVNSTNGMFFENQTVEDLKHAVDLFNTKKFNHSVVSNSANDFSPQVFRDNIKQIVKKLVS